MCLPSGELQSAESGAAALRFHSVTVHEAFRGALSALMGRRNWRPADVSRETGISDSMLSKLLDPEKNAGASFDTLERLRAAFEVEPAALFYPDYFASAGVQGVRSAPFDRLTRHQPEPGEGDVYPNDPMLSAFVRFWPDLSVEVRQELVSRAAAALPTDTGKPPAPKVAG